MCVPRKTREEGVTEKRSSMTAKSKKLTRYPTPHRKEMRIPMKLDNEDDKNLYKFLWQLQGGVKQGREKAIMNEDFDQCD